MRIQIYIFFALMMVGVKTVPDRGNYIRRRGHTERKEEAYMSV